MNPIPIRIVRLLDRNNMPISDVMVPPIRPVVLVIPIPQHTRGTLVPTLLDENGVLLSTMPVVVVNKNDTLSVRIHLA